MDEEFDELWQFLNAPPARRFDPLAPQRPAVPDDECEASWVIDCVARMSWPLQVHAAAIAFGHMLRVARATLHRAHRELPDQAQALLDSVVGFCSGDVRWSGVKSAAREFAEAVGNVEPAAWYGPLLRQLADELVPEPVNAVVSSIGIITIEQADIGADVEPGWLWQLSPERKRMVAPTLGAILADWAAGLPFARPGHTVLDAPAAAAVMEDRFAGAHTVRGNSRWVGLRLAATAAVQQGLREVLPVLRRLSDDWNDELTVLRDAGQMGEPEAADYLARLLVTGEVGRLHGVNWALQDIGDEDVALDMVVEQLTLTVRADADPAVHTREWRITLAQMATAHGPAPEAALPLLDMLAGNHDENVAAVARTSAESIREAPITECAHCGKPIRPHTPGSYSSTRYSHGRIHCPHCRQSNLLFAANRGGPGAHRLIATWNGNMPSATELRALRQLFPELRREQVLGLRRTLTRPSGEMPFGLFPAAVAARLLRDATANGLTMRSEPVDVLAVRRTDP